MTITQKACTGKKWDLGWFEEKMRQEKYFLRRRHKEWWMEEDEESAGQSMAGPMQGT